MKIDSRRMHVIQFSFGVIFKNFKPLRLIVQVVIISLIWKPIVVSAFATYPHKLFVEAK